MAVRGANIITHMSRESSRIFFVPKLYKCLNYVFSPFFISFLKVWMGPNLLRGGEAAPFSPSLEYTHALLLWWETDKHVKLSLKNTFAL